jgi:DNA-binding CsgD family transcriptional regulator
LADNFAAVSTMPSPSPSLHALPNLTEIQQLWDELASFPASRAEDALSHLMGWFQRHLDVDDVFWLGSLLMLEEEIAEGDPLRGWRLRARRQLQTPDEAYLKLVASYYTNEHYGKLTSAYRAGKHGPETDVHIGETQQNLVAGAGKFRAHRMRDGWIDYARFRRTEHYRLYYTNLNISDRIWIAYPLNAHTESYFLLDRHHRPGSKARKNFTDRDRDLAATVLRGQREFHRRLLLSNGVLRGVKSLSPLKLRILQNLLTGHSEKEIAENLDQRGPTLRKTITEIYNEFGVKTRPALMALWLDGE